MKISPSRVNRLLDRVKQVAPQLFPILAPRIAKMYELFMENYTCREIAETLGVTPRAVQYAIKELFRTRREVGLYFRSNSERRLSYRTYMDEWIKEKF
jgi:predicted transcriptional regulator